MTVHLYVAELADNSLDNVLKTTDTKGSFNWATQVAKGICFFPLLV